MKRWLTPFGIILIVAVVVSNTAAQESDRYMAAQRSELLAAAKTIIGKDPFPALVTIDLDGKPRTRTIEMRPLEDDWIFWFATKPNTRKVNQIKANPKVALYFSQDAEGSYVSVMGTATLHKDLKTINKITWRKKAQRSEFWPAFPKDYLLIRVAPEWIEVTGQGIPAHPDNWRPQAFEAN
ncbi:MAG: pyridoxamine 5'-phosphate oxidase family protein [Pseudomonadota bacterium]